MAENLRYLHPLRTEDLAALLVNELIDEDKRAKKPRGKTRAWIRRRSSKGYYNNIGKELMIEDTAVYKGIGTLRFTTARCYYGDFDRVGLG